MNSAPAAFHSQQASSNRRLWIHVAIAATITVIDGFLGTGVLAIASMFMLMVLMFGRAIVDRPAWKRNLQRGFIYLVAFIASLAWVEVNWSIAARHAPPVIAAVESYKMTYGEYPSTLDELVPKFLPSVPHAGYTLLSRDFYYYKGDHPTLYFVVMFVGRDQYDFKSRKWWTND